VLSGTAGGYKRLRIYRSTSDGEIYDVPAEQVEFQADADYDGLVRLLRGDTHPEAQIERALAVVQLLEAAGRSAARMQVVPLDARAGRL
jgi:hypothetical protein